MAESMQKKQKTGGGPIQYFRDFLSEQEGLIEVLRVVLGELNIGLAHTSLFFVQVFAANANSYAKFSSATINAEFIQRLDNPKRLVAPVALFFVRGFAILSDLLNKEDPKIPENMDERQALLGLVQFLKKINEESVLKENRDDSKRESAAALLAQHLLMPLVLEKSFVIDSSSGLWSENCCSVEHPIDGIKGDTSYGCPKGWHGCVDVLLGDGVPVSVLEAAKDEGEADSESVMSDSPVVVNYEGSTESVSQVIAQTIVNSFVQHRRNPASANSFVPGIGICSKKVVVYLYDCVEDILLTSGPVDLYADMNASGLNYRAIIILWLSLNYKLFGNTSPPEFKQYISNFHTVIGPGLLETYKEESEQPFRGNSYEEEFFKLFSEAKETACAKVKVSEYVSERKSISLK